jgi:hypothetical protein
MKHGRKTCPSQLWHLEVRRMCRTKFRRILTNYTRVDFAIIPESGIAKPSSCLLVNDAGDTVKSDTVRDYLLGVLMRREREFSDVLPGDNVERIRLLPRNLNIVDTESGANERVRQINLVAYSTNEEIELPPLSPRNLN